jgi:hypothetical protein
MLLRFGWLAPGPENWCCSDCLSDYESRAFRSKRLIGELLFQVLGVPLTAHLPPAYRSESDSLLPEFDPRRRSVKLVE